MEDSLYIFFSCKRIAGFEVFVNYSKPKKRRGDLAKNGISKFSNVIM